MWAFSCESTVLFHLFEYARGQSTSAGLFGIHLKINERLYQDVGTLITVIGETPESCVSYQ